MGFSKTIDMLLTMVVSNLCFYLVCVNLAGADWVSEWMSPLQRQMQEESSRRLGNQFDLKLFEDEERTLPVLPAIPAEANTRLDEDLPPRTYKPRLTVADLKTKLEKTLEGANLLAITLKEKIKDIESREQFLKEAIVNGQSGISTVVIKAPSFPTRQYIIRDGAWSRCRGGIQSSAGGDYSPLISTPRCVGREISTQRDPCAFNSVIKYEVIPEQRQPEYSEDDYLCLKKGFNRTLEQYLSVPKKLVDNTCKNGVVRKLSDNTEECGVRTMSEYTYYPTQSSSVPTLPLEYCTEADGSCKLIVAWHVSNVSVENFEILRSDDNFAALFVNNNSLATELA